MKGLENVLASESFLLIYLIAAFCLSIFVLSRNRDLKERLVLAAYFILIAYWAGVTAWQPVTSRPVHTTGLLLFFCFSLVISCKFMASLAIGFEGKGKFWSTFALLMVIPIISMLIYIFDLPGVDFHYSEVISANGSYVSGVWSLVVLAYLFVLIVIAIFLLRKDFKASGFSMLLFRWSLIHALAVSLFSIFSSVSGRFPDWFISVDVLFRYEVFSSYFILWAVFGWTSSNRVNRGAVVESMHDGWMVIDQKNHIIDINESAAGVLGGTRDSILDLPLTKFDLGIPLNRSSMEQPSSFEIQKSIKRRDENKYYSVQVSSISEPVNGPEQLLLWREITNKKLVENVRQKTRDAMFVLLNAVSGEASQSASVSEFLDGVIYQLIFTFRTQAAAVYLGDKVEKGIGGSYEIYQPVSVFGLPADMMPVIQSGSGAFEIINTVFDSGEPFQIEDPAHEKRLPPALREESFVAVLVLPLKIGQGGDAQNIGCMFLIRKEKPCYNNSELLQLGTLADHIANLVDNERRRKLAIALTERQRLMRDLHDSVSQKLYGLVTLTEAAQAIIETGGKFEPEKILSKIGENARQAVKEMRLFLHQMHPVEIEKEGFISALHHRLAAVEGRADIKAGLIADEKIKLMPDIEIALYYIAQEALNNILRHARAASVMVTYKQSKKNIILKITDDGRGFDLNEIDRSGLGLESMKERTQKINGIFKISSTPGSGTAVTVTIPKSNAIGWSPEMIQ